MNRNHALAMLLCFTLLFAAGCEQTSIARQEEIRSFETLQASTPSLTPTATQTPTSTPTSTPTATIGPSPTPLPPTETPIPSPTPLPPTITPNPALANFSLCTQTAGDVEGGRFSARVTTISTTVETAFERMVIGLDVPGDSAPPHATARCAPAASGGGYTLQLDLDGWLHDDLFSASVVSATQEFSGTQILKQLQYRFANDDPDGASIVVNLAEPLPFRVALEDNPYRLVLEVAKTSPIGPTSDMLAPPAAAQVDPPAPIFYLQDGDIWRYSDGNATNLTDTPENEIAFSASEAGGRIAFCRAAPGTAPGDALGTSSLWVMDLDGGNEQELAAPGRSCAEPVFSPDGTSIAFAVDEDETGALPVRLSIWSITLTSGLGPQRLTPPSDEWSRSGPQWLDNTQLVYTGVSEDGRSTLFLRNTEQQELDIGAALLVAEGSQGQSIPRFLGFGKPLVSPDGKIITVEAIRVDQPGADLLLLDATGAEVKPGPITDGYWNRPLAFGEDGTLYYLTTTCASDAVQAYTLRAQPRNGAARTIALGQTLGGFGQFTTVGDGLAYVSLAPPGLPGPRGPLNHSEAVPSALWFWDIGSGAPAQLVEAPDLITTIDQ